MSGVWPDYKYNRMTENELHSKINYHITVYKNNTISLIDLLKITQEIYGYLPFRIQKHLSQMIGIPFDEINKVVLSESSLITTVEIENTIRVCTRKPCCDNGGKKILEKIKSILGITKGEMTKDRKFFLDTIGCIGQCGSAPIIVINDTIYKNVDSEKLKSIFAKY